MFFFAITSKSVSIAALIGNLRFLNRSSLRTLVFDISYKKVNTKYLLGKQGVKNAV